MKYWDQLAAVIQREPVEDRDVSSWDAQAAGH